MNRSAAIGLGLVVVALGAFPAVDPGRYWIRLAFLTFLYVAMSLAWNLLGGLAGQTSFGYSVFFGLGAYATAVLWKQGLPPAVGIFAGGLVAALFSVLIGYPTFRLRGPYFAIATVGVAEAVRLVMLNWQSVTGGAAGLDLPPATNTAPVYYIGLALAGAAVYVTWRIQRSKFGLGLLAINAENDAAEALGVNSLVAKLQIHALAAFIVGFAGGLYVWDALFIEPRMAFSLNLSISLMLMPIIGGVGTVMGPVIGALIFSVVQELLLVSLPNLHLLFYGALLIVFVVFEPRGLMGLWDRFRPRRRAPARVVEAKGESQWAAR